MTKPKWSNSSPGQPSRLGRLAGLFNQPGWDLDIIVLLVLSVLTLAVFANVMDGEFIYDDSRQILQNPVVRDSNQFWQAFTSDVWAFKSGGAEPVSDYWRPAFIIWLVLNERLFGLDNTSGWHLTNIMLHIATAILAYILLRKIKLSQPITTAIVFIFLIHPAHVETVSWISGSPDLLMALPLLGACLLLLDYKKTADLKKYISAVLLFIVALLAKEAAILFPVLVFLFFLKWSSEKTGLDLKRILKAGVPTVPFLLVAALYLAARLVVLGQLFTVRSWQQPLGNILLTLPSLIAFYIRQSLFPIIIGPSYPLRIISPEIVGLQNFWLPLVVTIVFLGALGWFSRRSAIRQFGSALFLLFLLPALNINAFHPEQIVHDRYLYFPILGIWLLTILALTRLARRLTIITRFQDWKSAQFGVISLLVAIGFSFPLIVQTIRYNSAWKNDLSLWEWGVKTDPDSNLSTYLHGYYLFRDGRLDKAKTAFDRVIENQPLTGPYYSYFQAIESRLERADIAVRQENIGEARQDLSVVLNLTPEVLSETEVENLTAQKQRAVERLALTYLQEKDYQTAVEILEDGRRQLPQRACTLTTNLAISLYLSGQKERALLELESVQERVDIEYTPLCKMSLFYLGQLYLEAGQSTEARLKFTKFLALTQSFYDSQTVDLRNQALQLIKQIESR